MRTKLSSLLVAASFGAALALVGSATAEAKGGHGHGHGHGHGWGRGHGHHYSMHMRGTPYGWSRGRKVGWRGAHCPPGLAKKGMC